MLASPFLSGLPFFFLSSAALPLGGALSLYFSLYLFLCFYTREPFPGVPRGACSGPGGLTAAAMLSGCSPRFATRSPNRISSPLQCSQVPDGRGRPELLGEARAHARRVRPGVLPREATQKLQETENLISRNLWLPQF